MSLSLYGSSVQGTIPSEIGELTALTLLRLEDSPVQGSIPSEIGELTALTELRLGKYLILKGSNGGVEAFFARC